MLARALKNVVVIDKGSSIAGASITPHQCVGSARRIAAATDIQLAASVERAVADHSAQVQYSSSHAVACL